MQSDIEIYVKNINPTKAEHWLQHLGWQTQLTPVNRNTNKIVADTGDKSITVFTINSGKFTSIWFQSDQTPWAEDLECAKQAWQYFEKEVRASQGGWREDSNDDRWWKIDSDGENLIDWQGH
jgi:hypothetical protein